jgi:hypothetical protein
VRIQHQIPRLEIDGSTALDKNLRARRVRQQVVGIPVVGNGIAGIQLDRPFEGGLCGVRIPVEAQDRMAERRVRNSFPLHDPGISFGARRAVIDRPVVGADREHVRRSRVPAAGRRRPCA